MPIVEGKKNGRLLIIIGSILAAVILSAYFYHYYKTKQFPILPNGQEVTPSYKNEIKNQLMVSTLEFPKELKMIETYSNNDLPRTAQDSLNKLLYLRREDIIISNDLLKKLELYENLSKDDQLSLIEEVLEFLSSKGNSVRFKDCSEIAKSIVYGSKLEFAMQEIRTKDAIIKNLTKEIELFRGKYTRSESDLTRLRDLYALSTQQNQELWNSIYRLENDSIKNKSITDSLFELSKISNKQVEELKQELAGVAKIRIENFEFSSPNAKLKRDGSFIVGKMHSLQATFRIQNNNPKSKDKIIPLKLIFSFPESNGQKEDYIIDIKVPVGQIWKYVFYQDGLKFIPGVYTVQIIHEESSSKIPIDMKKIQAKRWL